MESVLKVENLKKSYQDFIAVNCINFDINKGEIFGFLGPNGAGKTSTINMLIGMSKITEGKVFYKGENLTNNIKKAQKIIGIVPDESNLYDEMTGFENLCFCGALYGIKKQERIKKANELLAFFQLSDFANKRFKAYSKGMKRKLTIAAALMHNPEILFLDEPTTGIDIMSVRQIRELIKNLNNSGTTIFMTTHYIEEAERLCHRVAFINKGKIINIDSVKNLVEQSKDNHILELTSEPHKLNKDSLLNELKSTFPDISINIHNIWNYKIISNNKLNLSPFINFFANKNIHITEAKLIHPSLEEAFIKMTGLEADTMKKEKEKR